MGEYADYEVDRMIDGYEECGFYRPRKSFKRRSQPHMIIEGKIYWAKIDRPRDNYNKQKKIMKDGEPDRWGREYSITLSNLSKETKLQLRDAGLLDKVKNKMDDQEDHITFRMDEYDRDGDPQEFKVVDADGEPWDWKENGLIGNESFGAVKFNIWKKPGIKARIYPLSLMVLDHVEYEQEEGAGEREDADDWSAYKKTKAKPATTATAKAKTKTKAVTDEELDDDVPFDSGN